MLKDLQGKLQKVWGGTPLILKNKYVVMSLIFLVWMTFFDRNNFIVLLKLHKTESNMERDKEKYIEDIQYLKEAQIDLNDNIERFAREKYFLKKPNEEVFIISKD